MKNDLELAQRFATAAMAGVEALQNGGQTQKGG